MSAETSQQQWDFAYLLTFEELNRKLEYNFISEINEQNELFKLVTNSLKNNIYKSDKSVLDNFNDYATYFKDKYSRILNTFGMK